MAATGPGLVSHLPQELIDTIFAYLYDDLQPAPSLDAEIRLARVVEEPPLTGTAVFAKTQRNEAISTFYNLCLVCKEWTVAAQPYLFRHIAVEVPRQWESLLEVIAEPDEDERAGRSQTIHGARTNLISPPQSRQGSRSRSRSRARSPGRGEQRAQSIDARLRGVELERRISEDTPPIPNGISDRLPGLHIETISFSTFRTVGLRRTIREGSQQRFVTLSRVLRLLQGTRSVGLLSTTGEFQDPYLEEDEDPNDERGRLKAVGFTEYMDSALQREVLDELLLRGGVEVETKAGPMLTGSPAALAAFHLQALDLCGCVSGHFVEGISAFIGGNQVGKPDGYRFPHLKRLGLHSVHIGSELLELFVGSFTSLTHLDLTNTRATPRLLEALTSKAPALQLHCLSLARCRGLTGASIRAFLEGEMTLEGGSRNASTSLTELSLYGDEASPSPLSREEMIDIMRNAPCFRSGRLRYLDIATVPLARDDLLHLGPQPSLIDFGMAFMWELYPLSAVFEMLPVVMPNLQVLDLTNTCMSQTRGACVNIMDLHRHLFGHLMLDTLRVIEFDEDTLTAIAGGAGNWKVVRGKGRRGWYVDIPACGPELAAALNEVVRDERLTPSSLGWHARKMEVLLGHGFFGRDEGGLYAFHAFGV